MHELTLTDTAITDGAGSARHPVCACSDENAVKRAKAVVSVEDPERKRKTCLLTEPEFM